MWREDIHSPSVAPRYTKTSNIESRSTWEVFRIRERSAITKMTIDRNSYHEMLEFVLRSNCMS